MDWQQVASLMIVGLTAVLMVRRVFHRGSPSALPDCCAACKAGHPPTPLKGTLQSNILK